MTFGTTLVDIDIDIHIDIDIDIDIYVSSNKARHSLTKTFTPLHYTSPNYSSLHFTHSNRNSIFTITMGFLSQSAVSISHVLSEFRAYWFFTVWFPRLCQHVL